MRSFPVPARLARLLLPLSLITPALAFAQDDSGFQVSGYAHYYLRDYDELAGAAADESELRRFNPVFEYKSSRWSARLMADLMRDTNKLLDAYVGYTSPSGWDLRIGRSKTPLSIDRLKSANAVAVGEASAVAVMASNRDNGIVWGHGGKGERNWRWEAGVVNGAAADEVKGSIDGDYDVLARVVRTTPLAGGSLRAGLAASVGEREGEVSAPGLARYRTPGRASWFRYRSDVVADGRTSHVAAFSDYYHGPGFVQAEWIQASETARGSTVSRHLSHRGWEVQAGYVLTGEKRGFGGVTPAHWEIPGIQLPVAVELAGHVGRIDVDRDAFAAGLANPLTSGQSAQVRGAAVSFWFPKRWRVLVGYDDTRIDIAGPASDLREKLTTVVGVMTF